MTVTPLDMPVRKAKPATVRLAYRTWTGKSTSTAPEFTARPELALGYCPGCECEASKSVGVMLGCEICAL